MPSNDPLLNAATDWAVIAIFGVVYLGMFLGGLPRLRLDRSGVALLGAIAVIEAAGLRVNASVHNPLLCVSNVFKVASGDLSLPGKVNR